MENERVAWTPEWAVTPGEVLQEALDERNISQSGLARRMGRPTKTINEIVNGKAAITPDTAIQLELALGISHAFWNRLEVNYREKQAVERARVNWSKAADWAKSFPLKEMRERGLVSEVDDGEAVWSVLSFFGVSSPDAWRSEWCSPAVQFKRQEKFETSEFALSAWLREGEIEASNVECQPFDPVRLNHVLAEIRPLTRQEPVHDAVEEATDLLATVGVALVVVRGYPKLPVSGAALWMSRTKARVQLTLRFKKADSFWFSLYHECGHLQTRRGEEFIEWDSPDDPEAEKFANEFAREALIPSGAYDAFLEAGTPSVSAVREFAKDLRVAPGIVVGRLQHDKVIDYSKMNHLKRDLVWS